MDRPAPYPYADPRAPPSDYRRRVCTFLPFVPLLLPLMSSEGISYSSRNLFQVVTHSMMVIQVQRKSYVFMAKRPLSFVPPLTRFVALPNFICYFLMIIDDGDVSAKDMSHEERREREKPTRTLFIRNIPYEANQTEVNDIFASYGKLARFYNLITKRGMAFVTYVRLKFGRRIIGKNDMSQIRKKKDN